MIRLDLFPQSLTAFNVKLSLPSGAFTWSKLP